MANTETWLPENMPLRINLRAKLRQALKAGERERAATLRSLLGAIDNAEAVEAPPSPSRPLPPGRAADVPRRVLTEHDLRAILQAEARECQQALAACELAGRQAEQAQLRAALELMTRYLAEAEV